LRNLLKELNISTEFESYDINEIEMKNSLKNNKRAENSLVFI
jgi:hypothetical protein